MYFQGSVNKQKCLLIESVIKKQKRYHVTWNNDLLFQWIPLINKRHVLSSHIRTARARKQIISTKRGSCYS